MILLDTHVWVWWVQGDSKLPSRVIAMLDDRSEGTTGVHIISCWEVAMLHVRNRLCLPGALEDWMEQALSYPGVRQIPLTAGSACQSCLLPGDFHKDPADRMLVASAIERSCPLITADNKILDYPHVEAIHPSEFEC